MIVRSKGIEGLVEGYVPGVVEEERIEVVGVDKFAELLEKYEKFLEILRGNPECHPSCDAYRKFKERTKTITPVEVNAFLQATRVYQDKENYSMNTGLMVSSLIDYSYQQGHTHFYLDTMDLTPLDNIGFKVGNKEGPQLCITINGNVGNFCGNVAKNVIFTIKGNAGSFLGDRAENSIFNIEGDTEEYCGSSSSYCAFNLQGSIRKVYDVFVPQRSTFKTANQDVAEKLLSYLRESDNKIIFIHPDGTEELVQNV